MLNNILNFFFELRQLRESPRSGWQIIGVPNAESVAEHSARTAQIAYVLALLEEHPDPEHIATMALFHDIAECRTGDLHKIAQRYVDADEQVVVEGMTESLNVVGDSIRKLWHEAEERGSPAAIIAKDADLLDVAVSAREYMAAGFKEAEDWYKNAGTALKTEQGKRLWTELGFADPNAWWKGLKKFS